MIPAAVGRHQDYFLKVRRAGAGNIFIFIAEFAARAPRAAQ
jgi:hypothetical protein